MSISNSATLSRRGLLALLAGAALDAERLVWRPGKLISIPRPTPAWEWEVADYDLGEGWALMTTETVTVTEFIRHYPRSRCTSARTATVRAAEAVAILFA